ncbi:MAG: diacylglycerol kinase family lipid kinase [Clostridia bacterium]|nr:diacylglycerol kinase family lipid kinase [Clostridia bacterium]
MNRKNIMLIVNPCAGRRWGEKHSESVAEWFREGGAECSLYFTDKRGDGTEFVCRDGDRFDIIACMGGDGTLNEVINGMLKSHLDTPLGYIPTGSTNDFAASMQLASQPEQAVRDILACCTEAIDAGRFTGKERSYFGYVASFGAFTATSYRTPQPMKNRWGRLSYFLEGIRDLGDIRAEHKIVYTDGQTFEGDYLFGAFSNSRRIGGLVQYSENDVDVSDEQLEMLLIRKPACFSDLYAMLHSLAHSSYEGNPYIDFCRSDRFVVESDSATQWSLDGEYADSERETVISCIKHKINFIRPVYA